MEVTSAEIYLVCLKIFARITALPRASAYWEDATTDGVIREAELALLDPAQCAAHLGGAESDAHAQELSSLVCAGPAEAAGNQSACFVGLDGGSPLSCESGGRHYLGGELD